MDQAKAPETLETLDTMRRALTEVAALIRQAAIGNSETREVTRTLTVAERRLATPSADRPADPAIVAAWRHEMRGAVNAMVVWGHVLVLRAHDEVTRLRALEAIGRNAKQLRSGPLDLA